jgi:hypothetical protein
MCSAFGWLYKNHPRTAIKNLPLLVEPVCTGKNAEGPHGYWKDLLNILCLATVDQLSVEACAVFLHNASKTTSAFPTHRGSQKSKNPADVAARAIGHQQRQAMAKADAKQARVVAALEAHARLLEKLSDKKYRALYIAVARLFSQQLIKDWQLFKQLEVLEPKDRSTLIKQISLAGKWAPTPLASHDRPTNIATAICLLLHHYQITAPFTFPSAANAPLSAEQYYLLRCWYQRSVLTPLRMAMAIPEPLMSSNRWTEIKYDRVASKCMKINTEKFYIHNPEGFEKYLTDVESGKKKISGATLMPHELVAQACMLGLQQPYDLPEEDENVTKAAKLSMKDLKRKLAAPKLRVIEAQWNTLIEKLRESGSLDNCLAICDVSGSMGSLYGRHDPKHVSPILPAVSLSLVLAQLAKPPFDNGFITFSSDPKYVQLDASKTLVQKVADMIGSDWGANTDFNAVFLRLLLPLAKKNKLKRKDMIKRLFVFSDMQFDQCSAPSRQAAKWKTNHDVIEKEYKKAGYEVPQIVYWNLADSLKTVPVTGQQKGVALMSGFSPALLKVFMGEEEAWEEVMDDGTTNVVEETFDPVSVMKKALLKPSFDGLIVVD